MGEAIEATTLDGGAARLGADELATLAGSLRGELAPPGSPGYVQACTLWNAMIERRPALVVRCAGTPDVMHAVRFAATRGLRLSVRGAGHNIAGNGLCDGGVAIDLSAMRAVRVDPARRTVRVEPGCTLGDIDHDTQAFGLATPTGINSTTGIAGLTLGGGFGWLSRAYGLTADNLLSADLVTADGALRHVDEAQHPDLYWAIRGGGGNFGVVTSFEFQLHEVGPEVLAGLIVHPYDAAPEVLRFYRDFVAGSSDELTVWFVLRQAPPLPFLPPEVHGREIVILAACYAGDPHDGERELVPLREYGQPIADVIGPHPFAAWQQAFDPLLGGGARNYWKSHNFTELPDELLDRLVDFQGRLPTPLTELFVGRLGGAVNRVAPDATAYPHRDVEFVMNVHTRWEAPADDQACIAWARELFDATAPFATGGAYGNFMSEDERRAPAAYGGNYRRLARIKATYDPDNLFRVNQNIEPRY
jgi:FAD/FMN-containing dehydrogenase